MSLFFALGNRLEMAVGTLGRSSLGLPSDD